MFNDGVGTLNRSRTIQRLEKPMRFLAVPLLGIVLAIAPGCGQTKSLSFDEAFERGLISWKPVKNVEIVTQTADGQKVDSFDFVTSFSYDANGKRSEDTAGQKKYIWADREATFGPDAVVQIVKDTEIRDGTIRAGDEWTWTGKAWTAKPKS